MTVSERLNVDCSRLNLNSACTRDLANSHSSPLAKIEM